MTELELISLWTRARWHVIVSQVAPVFLLTLTVGYLAVGLGGAPVAVKVAGAGVVLASGVLGAAVQFSAAREARAVIRDLTALGELGQQSATSRQIIASGWFVTVVSFVGPAIFVVVFVAILAAVFVPGAGGDGLL